VVRNGLATPAQVVGMVALAFDMDPTMSSCERRSERGLLK
jgi:hypothetical protein